ncbi:MAG: 1,4-dihydroxy-2-naphthoate octaprenyltransferase [Chloroflexi bacterium]|nr:1,4-dihydroxy-2-naphthoate octaprenyltransferase [Chloroflexota bacterium]
MTNNQAAPAAKMPPLWVIKTRAPFFTADLAPVCLGAAIAWAQTDTFNLWYFLLTLVGAICLNAGTNMTNDYFDHKWGSDEVNTEFVNPFTGGSRLIQMGMVKPEVFLRQGIGFFVVGSLIGLVLTLTRGPWVLWLGLIGVFAGYFYTAPPFRLVGVGLGELLIGLCFGPLMVLGSYYTQTQAVTWEPVIAALPVGILITLVVWINQFQDMKADAAVGKNHWVVRLGRKRSVTVYGISLALVYLSVVVGVLFGVVTPFALLGLLTLPIAVKAYRVARVHYDNPQELTPANAATIQVHLMTGLLVTLGYVIQGIVGRLL